MSEDFRTHNYEAMFLFPQSAGPRLTECVDHIIDIITRHGGEMLALKKWDERRLAFEIEKQKRGLYLLGYFRIHASGMGKIERDLRLSELVMRHLITRADQYTLEEMTAMDARQDLAIEGKLRAEKAAEEAAAAEIDQSVSLGAPEARRPAADEAEDDAEAVEVGESEQD